METRQCFLCGKPSDFFPGFGSDQIQFGCPRCGHFQISEEAVRSLTLTPEQKAKLSSYCRRASNGGKMALLRTNTVGNAINSVPDYSPLEKLDMLLDILARLSPSLARASEFCPELDYPLVSAADEAEVEFMLSALAERGLVIVTPGGMMSSSRATVKMNGWERVEEIRSKAKSLTRVFVAMWFSDSTNEVYDQAIKPAITEAGYEPLRIDQFEHVNRIDDEIVGQIRRSRFMIADFTGQRHGVYFEAGMMLGLGRNVIWMCQKPELRDVHFDNRQYNFIDYANTAEAKTRLYNRIIAIEGEGPGTQTKTVGAGR